MFSVSARSGASFANSHGKRSPPAPSAAKRGKNVHEACFAKWKLVKSPQNATCVICQQPWKEGPTSTLHGQVRQKRPRGSPYGISRLPPELVNLGSHRVEPSRYNQMIFLPLPPVNWLYKLLGGMRMLFF